MKVIHQDAMRYPDGSTIRTGDLIWWNGGSCVGYVQAVLDREEEFEAWGLAHPHLFLSNNHPYDSGETSGISYHQDCLSDEGIGLLTTQESADLAAAVATARIEEVAFSVFADIHNGIMTHWRFEIRNSARAGQIIRVPIGSEIAAERSIGRAGE